VEIAATFLLKNTLPAEVAQFVKAQEATDVTGRQAAALLPSLLVFAAMFAGLIGLWWCKRWARLLFSVAAVLSAPLSTILGLVSPEMLVSNAVETGADIASSMLMGGIIAMTWFGMPEEFNQPYDSPASRTAVAGSGIAS
jgi:hypothetical protein